MTRSEPDTDAIVRLLDRMLSDEPFDDAWHAGLRAGVEGCAQVLEDASTNKKVLLAMRIRPASFLRALAAGFRSKVTT